MQESGGGKLKTQSVGITPLRQWVATQWAASLQDLGIQEKEQRTLVEKVRISSMIAAQSHGGTFSVEQSLITVLLSLSIEAWRIELPCRSETARRMARASPCCVEEARVVRAKPSQIFPLWSLMIAAMAAFEFVWFQATSQLTL